MKLIAFISLSLVSLTACTHGVAPMQDRTAQPCGNKPNCVSTEDTREAFHLAPFTLTDNATLDDVERAALMLPGAKTAERQADYLRIECTTRIMRFVDDLELRIRQQQLMVRSESRLGYSDFGVNRKRVEQLRSLLLQQGVIIE